MPKTFKNKMVSGDSPPLLYIQRTLALRNSAFCPQIYFMF